MDALEKASRLQTRVQNEERTATPDWLERVQLRCQGKIKDDRVTCNECKNNKGGRCLARQGWNIPHLKQRCIKYLKIT